jgi:DNA repair protein RecO
VLLSLYTREHGKVRLVAKGARRVKGGYGSAAMPLSIIEASYSLKEGRDLHTLRTAETLHALRNVSQHYEHMTTALAIAEVVEITQPVQEKNEELFVLLINTMNALNAATSNTYNFFAYFCVHCAHQMRGEAVFSFEDGRVVMPPIDTSLRVWRMPFALLRTLAHIAGSELEHVAEIHLEHSEQRHLQDFFVRYYSYHLDKSVVFRTEDMMLGIQRS